MATPTMRAARARIPGPHTGRNVSNEAERFVKRSFKGNARFLVVQKSRPDTFHWYGS